MPKGVVPLNLSRVEVAALKAALEATLDQFEEDAFNWTPQSRAGKVVIKNIITKLTPKPPVEATTKHGK